MNKKGFTTIEIISSIIITLVIILISISINKVLLKSRQDSAKEIEKTLKNTLEKYNLENESYLWCESDDYLGDDGEVGCNDCKPKDGFRLGITFEELLSVNPNLDLKECLLNNNIETDTEIDDIKNFGLVVTQKKSINECKVNYSYQVSIVCSKDFKEKSKYSTDGYNLNIDNHPKYKEYYSSQ